MRGRIPRALLLRVPAVVLLLSACAPVPDPAPEPGSRFDAGRAARDLATIASLGPRPAGSLAAERARALLAERLSATGLFVREQALRGRDVRSGLAGEVGMVLAEIPGRGRSAILVTANVDGSGDGRDVARALGPAVLLELARALRAGARPTHTLILVATESAGRSLGVRALAAHPPARRPVVLEVALEPRGLAGEAALLWASPGAAPAIDAWARAVDAPAGGAHLSLLLPERPAWRPWPAVGVGTRRALVLPGSPRDRVDRVRLATVRSLGQSVLDLVRAADGDEALAGPRRAPRPGRRAAAPAYLELPLHLLIPIGPATAVWIGWLALAGALWGLFRLRRLVPMLVVTLPWGAAGVALAAAAMAAIAELLARPRGTEAPLRATPAAHVASVLLAGLWVLLAWQRVGSWGPLRRVASGLSQPAVLALLSLFTLSATTAACLSWSPSLVPLVALPLLVAAPSAVAVASAVDRRRRFTAAFPVVVALTLVGGPALADAAVFLLVPEPRHADLALGLAALALPVLPALAAAATASILRPGAGQLVFVAVLTAALAVWTATAPPATKADPRRVVITAVSDARRGHGLFVVEAADALHVRGARAGRPWTLAALEGGGTGRVLRAPDGLSAPPEVQARLVDLGAGRVRLEARLRPLRRAETLAVLLPGAVRISRSTVPVVRRRPAEPWIARIFAPPPAGVSLRMELTLPRGVGLGQLFAMDTGPASLGPLLPRFDRAWPTTVIVRSVGFTPLDTVYATPPPPPVLPPDDPPLPPAGPEPWWSIMARERYRGGGSQ